MSERRRRHVQNPSSLAASAVRSQTRRGIGRNGPLQLVERSSFDKIIDVTKFAYRARICGQILSFRTPLYKDELAANRLRTPRELAACGTFASLLHLYRAWIRPCRLQWHSEEDPDQAPTLPGGRRPGVPRANARLFWGVVPWPLLAESACL